MFNNNANMATLTPTEITAIFSDAALTVCQELGMTDQGRVSASFMKKRIRWLPGVGIRSSGRGRQAAPTAPQPGPGHPSRAGKNTGARLAC